jgi:hypothetical protein
MSESIFQERAEEPVTGEEAPVENSPFELYKQSTEMTIETLTGELENERQRRIEAEQRVASGISRMEIFKSQVRDVAIEAHKRGFWCREGMNEKLQELGIERYLPSYTVHMVLEGYVTVQGADSEDQARSWAESAINLESNDGDVFEPTIDNFRVTAVEEDEE